MSILSRIRYLFLFLPSEHIKHVNNRSTNYKTSSFVCRDGICVPGMLCRCEVNAQLMVDQTQRNRMFVLRFGLFGKWPVAINNIWRYLCTKQVWSLWKSYFSYELFKTKG